MLKNSKSVEPKKAVLRAAQEVVSVEQYWHKAERPTVRKPPKNYKYTEELAHLQFELIKFQEWVRTQKLDETSAYYSGGGSGLAGAAGVLLRDLRTGGHA